MRLKRFLLVLVLLLVCVESSLGGDPIKMRIGSIPVLQALPLFVAESHKIFDKNGIQVEIVPFGTVTDKDMALSTGSIDGYFGDLLTPIVLEGNGKNVKIVATNYDTRQDRRMFAILVKPGSKCKIPSDMAGVPIAVSSNTVVHHVADRLLDNAGLPTDKREFMESKNIGLRMQMLLSGQVEAAVLPEPLVTAALQKGAAIIADDSGLDSSQTVFAFRDDFIKKHPEAVTAFLKSLNNAVDIIRNNPQAASTVMVEQTRLPEQLKSSYPIPKFEPVRAPDKEAVTTIITWLSRNGITPASLTYEQVVNAKLLP